MATITEDYVSFEIAKLLKKKGFNEECEYFYDEYDENEYVICSNGGSAYNDDKHPTYYSMPTLQMVMKWLREVHNIFISIVFCFYPTEKRVTWTPEISTFDSVFPESVIEYNSYEEATEASIRYCLENLI